MPPVSATISTSAHRNRSSCSGRSRSPAGRSGAVQARPRTSTQGMPSSAFAHDEPGGGRDRVRLRRPRVDFERSAIAVLLAAPVPERRHARAQPSATFVVPSRHGRPKLSLIIDAGRRSGDVAQPARSRAADRVGSSSRQQQDAVRRRGRSSDRHRPAPSRSPVGAARSARSARRAAPRSTRDRIGLDETRILAAHSRELVRAPRRRKVRERDARPSAFETIFCATTRTSKSRRVARIAYDGPPERRPGRPRGRFHRRKSE